jgi:hypothetical protein
MPLFTCAKCGDNNKDNFYAANPRYCKRCQKDAVYRSRLKKMGLTIEDQARIADKQGNKCAICKQPAKLRGRALHQDHSHATGKHRGLLCGRCNHLLGFANDSVDVLKEAIAYLEGH